MVHQKVSSFIYVQFSTFRVFNFRIIRLQDEFLSIAEPKMLRFQVLLKKENLHDPQLRTFVI